MKLISWNVNGLRAVLRKEFAAQFAALNADVFCVQETKCQPGEADFAPVRYGIGKEEHSHEGRAITLEFERFFLVNVYVPNAQEGLARIDYRMQWEDDLRAYLLALDAEKPVVLCGDMNVAHEEIDLKNPKTNRGSACFSDQERGKMTELLAAGFVDSFRALYPARTGAYTWWSYKFGARKNNAGWRIDYFIVSGRLQSAVKDSLIFADYMGSDHCPVGLELEL